MSCNSEAVEQLVTKLGNRMTNNIFFVENNVWFETLKTELFIIKNLGGTITHKTVQSSEYFAWDYTTNTRRQTDSKTFYTQLSLYKFFRDNHEGYMDKLFEELLNHDLTSIAIISEHLF